MAEKESWHLSRNVPVALMLTMLMQTVGVVWWAASMQSNVEVNTSTIAVNRATIERLRDESVQRDIQLSRIETSQRAIQTQLEQISRSIERIAQ